MQRSIYFDVQPVKIGTIGIEQKHQQTDTETATEPVVAANDNELAWPLISFPEGWYTSF